jgi:hypothetical protein
LAFSNDETLPAANEVGVRSFVFRERFFTSQEVAMSAMNRSVFFTSLVPAVGLLLGAGHAQAQCRGVGGQQMRGPQQSTTLTGGPRPPTLTSLLLQQQLIQLTTLQQARQQQYALTIAVRLQEQYDFLTALQQQRLFTLLTALQQQHDLLNAVQLQQLNALLLWQQQQQNAAVAQLRAVPLLGGN